VDDLKRIAPPTARATANGLRVLSLFLLLVSISAGQSAELVTQAPEAEAVEPGAAIALPSICDRPIPIADAPSAPLARLRCVQDAGGMTRLELSIPGRAALPLTGPGGRALLILDDGAAGWLLVPLQVPDLSPAGGLDPAAPGPIPALASCWLYNHRTRLAADAGHPYPPAPAEQVRADHAAPADCCTVESSPDGRRILVFGTPAVPQPATEPVTPATPPRQLLALYDVTTRQCWSANLAVDGQLGRAPYDGLGEPVFSPDGRHLGFRARRGEARFVVVDDREGAVFHRVGAPVFSADGRHSAYWARDRGREFIVFDGTPGRTWTGAGAPVFSPAGGPPAYRAQDAKGWRAVVDGTPGPLFDDIGWFNTDATGRTTAIADLVFSAKGELAYAARTGEDWFMVRDHRRGPAYEQVGLPVFSPDGTRFAYRAARHGRDFIVLDGRPGPEYNLVGTPVFSVDGQRVAYWAADAWTEFVVTGTAQGPRVDTMARPLPPLTDASPNAGPDASRAAHAVTAVVQGLGGGAARAAPGWVGTPVFARTGHEPVYAVGLGSGAVDDYGSVTVTLWSGDQPRQDGKVGEGAVLNRITGGAAWWDTQGDSAQVMFEGRHLSGDIEGPSPLPALVFSPDGQLLAYGTNRGGRARMRIGETADGRFDEVADPVFSPAGDRLAYRARLGSLWFPIVAPLAGTHAPAMRPPATAPLGQVAPLDEVAVRLLLRPVAVDGIIVGSSAHGRWYGPESVGEVGSASAIGSGCIPIGPARVDPTQRWRVYGPDRLLGDSTGGKVSDCPDESTGTRQLWLTLPDRDLQESTVAIAAPWNALPRRALPVPDNARFAELAGQLRERLGRTALPLRDLGVQAADLDGDGRSEYLVRAAGGAAPDRAASDDAQYVLLLLARSDQDPKPAVLCDWSGVPDSIGDCEVSHLLDLNGDGTLEIVIRYSAYEEWGVQVFTLEGGRPMKTPLGWWDGV